MWNKILVFLDEFLLKFLIDTSKMLVRLVIIISVLLVALEILKALKVINKINKIIYPITKYLGVSPSASIPLLIGTLFGITYGAGAIITSYNNQEMNKKDVVLVSVFLCLCHALIEDTIIFMSFGANPFIVVGVRFFLAYFLTIIVNLLYQQKENKQIKLMNNDE